jgi:hypothetical protein
MKTIAIISVGKDGNGNPYHTLCIEDIKKLIKDYDIRVLTDEPSAFNNIGCTIYEYDKKIFTYFDKFFFSFRLIKELKKDILYIDCDHLCDIVTNEKYRTLESNNQILYLTFWPVNINGEWRAWKYLPDMNIEKWVRPIIEFIELEGSDSSKIETMFEQLYYFPVNLDYDKIQYELEKIKPVFEYASLYSKNLYRRTIYGHGEGLALSYVLHILNIEKKAIVEPLSFEEGYNFVSKTNLIKNFNIY